MSAVEDCPVAPMRRPWRAGRAATLAVLGCAAAAGVQAALTTTTVVSVGDMVAGQWTQLVLADQGNTSVGFGVQASGGNPGSFWQTDLSNPGGAVNSADRIANVFTGAVWNPATQGAIETLAFTFDARGLLSQGLSGGVTGFLRPVIEQAGIVFSVQSTDTAINASASWQTIQRLFQDDSAWFDVTGALQPDFSDSGAPIHFGYRFGIGLTCPSGNCNAVQTRLGVDNFSVTLGTLAPAAVPEPDALALLAVALAGAAVVRRRAPRARAPVRSRADITR